MDDYNPREVITDIVAILTQPDKFAEVFCQAAAKQKDIDKVLQTIIRDLIQTDQPTRDSIKDLIKDYEKQEWWMLIKRVGKVGWSIFVAIISTTFGYWLKSTSLL